MSEKSSTVTDDMEETKMRHKKYLRAINNPARRNILRQIADGNSTIQEISENMDLDLKTLRWHMSILLDGYCVQKKGAAPDEKYILTKEASVVDFLDK